MGEYFCDICKFYDDDIDKGLFHCNDCGMCRTRGRENFFHCMKCGSCYSISLRNNHLCVENSMRHHCPICYENLFDSLKDTTVMKCGHTMHCECYHELMKRRVQMANIFFTELDRHTGQPCFQTKEFNLVRNMLIAAVDERYRDADSIVER